MQAEHEKSLAALLLSLGVICALFFPQISHALAPYLLHSLFFVMVFSLLPFVRLSVPELIRPHPVVLALVGWQQFILPALTLFLGIAFDFDREWLIFLLITVTSGSLFASPTLVQLMGLEQKMAVQTVILSTFAAPVSIYLTFSYLLGSDVDLQFDLFAFRLVIFLAVPIAIFCIVRILTGNWTERSKDKLDGLGRWGSVFALIVFCFALENEVTYAIKTEPERVLEYLAVAVIAAVLVGVLTRIVMSRFGTRSAMTATILTSFRNVGLTFGLVGQYAGPELAVYVGVCQIPMFFSPLLFDLFVGKSKTPSDEGKETSQGVEVSQNTMPLHQLSGNGMVGNGGSSSRTAVSAQPAYDYYPVGNTVVATARSAEYATAQAQVASAPVEVTAELQNDRLKLDKEREDTRALIQRVKVAHKEAALQVMRLSEDAAANRSATQFAGLFVLLCIVGLTGFWHANKYFSPMLFDNKLLERVAQAHVNGQNFATFDLNLNIRDLRNATISRMTRTPEMVVLGASHWQEAHVNLLPGKDWYNSHVHRDYYEDMLAVTEMWVRNNKLPKEMIITIRDNLLTPIADRTDFLWLPGIKYYRDFAARIKLEPHNRWETLPVNTWRELLSMPLLYSQIKTHITAPVQPHETAKRNFATLDTLLPDGSILWSGTHRQLFTRARARSEALAFANARRNDPPKIDPEGVAHLEALFEFLKKKGVKVTLAHPQFNPVFWDAVQDSPYTIGLQKVVNLTKRWSRKYGFPVIGGFAPEDVGCKADMYIDAEHGNATCLGMLLQQYALKESDFGLRGSVDD